MVHTKGGKLICPRVNIVLVSGNQSVRAFGSCSLASFRTLNLTLGQKKIELLELFLFNWFIISASEVLDSDLLLLRMSLGDGD